MGRGADTNEPLPIVSDKKLSKFLLYFSDYEQRLKSENLIDGSFLIIEDNTESETINLIYTPYTNVAGSYTYATAPTSGKFTLAFNNSNYSISVFGNSSYWLSTLS